MSEPIVEDNRCAKCRWHSKDGLFCENPNSYFYGWFRNDWKRCDKYDCQSSGKEQTLYGYPIEHLEMFARVMAKENCTPEVVAQMLQNAGEIARIVRDEMMEMLKESVERACKGVADDSL